MFEIYSPGAFIVIIHSGLEALNNSKKSLPIIVLPILKTVLSRVYTTELTFVSACIFGFFGTIPSHILLKHNSQRTVFTTAAFAIAFHLCCHHQVAFYYHKFVSRTKIVICSVKKKKRRRHPLAPVLAFLSEKLRAIY